MVRFKIKYRPYLSNTSLFVTRDSDDSTIKYYASVSEAKKEVKHLEDCGHTSVTIVQEERDVIEDVFYENHIYQHHSYDVVGTGFRLSGFHFRKTAEDYASFIGFDARVVKHGKE